VFSQLAISFFLALIIGIHFCVQASLFATMRFTKSGYLLNLFGLFSVPTLCASVAVGMGSGKSPHAAIIFSALFAAFLHSTVAGSLPRPK
jgi:hypothetical protein